MGVQEQKGLVPYLQKEKGKRKTQNSHGRYFSILKESW
jgi:hypothetical protein